MILFEFGCGRILCLLHLMCFVDWDYGFNNRSQINFEYMIDYTWHRDEHYILEHLIPIEKHGYGYSSKEMIVIFM